jgi:hypothetical protein
VRSWLLGPQDDTRDALIEAALGAQPTALAAWSRLVAAGIGSHPDPVAARWMPLVHQNIGRWVTDPASRQVLEQADRQAWGEAARLMAAANPAVRALRAAGIEVVLLKGAALAATIYPHLGVRPFSDVDLLVRPADFARAGAALTTLGWTSSSVPGPANAIDHARSYSGPARGFIDLHRYLLLDTPWPQVDDGLWQRTVPVNAHGMNATVLGPADQVLHLAVHGLRWSPVHAATWLADAAWTIRVAGPALDWTVLVTEAHRRGLGYQVGEALRLVGRAGHVDVPDLSLTALGTQATMIDRLECRLKVRRPHGARGMVAYWLAWRRALRGQTSRGPGLLSYFASAAGLQSAGQLGGWLRRRILGLFFTHPIGRG